jgi:hypothetical protein
MIDSFRVWIYQGLWQSGYEPYDMPGADARTRYTLRSTDNSGLPKDGTYRGIMIADKTLRLIAGGECHGGAIVNHSFSDFLVEFDDDYHDEYKRGLERGYKGKRRCSDRYLYSQSENWQNGYRNGIEAKLPSIAA